MVQSIEYDEQEVPEEIEDDDEEDEDEEDDDYFDKEFAQSMPAQFSIGS